MPTFALGKDAKLYLGTTSVELSNVTDVTLDMTKETSDVTTRASGSWKSTVGTLKDATLSFTSMFDSTDTTYTTLMNAYINNTDLIMRVLTGATGAGPTGTWIVTKATRNEKLTEGITVDFELKLKSFTSWSSGTTSDD